jgi:hypothetical protein
MWIYRYGREVQFSALLRRLDVAAAPWSLFAKKIQALFDDKMLIAD